MNNRMNTAAVVAFIFAVSMLLGVACGRVKAGASSPEAVDDTAALERKLEFSGDSALLFVKGQTDFGPRTPGTKAHYTASRWLIEELRRHGADVTEQNATLTTFDGVRIPMVNILGTINPEADRRIMLVAHWDTRPWADQDPDPKRRKEKVMGANDGGSGVGVLLELARVLGSRTDLPVGIDFLMVDAEDWGEEDNDESWAMGTRYFMQNPPEGWKPPEAAIVVDMVGDPEATFVREYFSEQAAPALNAKVWSMADRLGYEQFFINRLATAVTDDHVELIKGGIPAIDIIDYRPATGFPSTWHTTSDTFDRLSPAPLEAVGRTLEALIISDF